MTKVEYRMTNEGADRRGITLLETLFAIFVMAIGILSLASLIPVGKVLITQAERSDRGSAVAAAAMNEFINRNYVHYAGGESDSDNDGVIGDDAIEDLNGDGIPNTAYPILEPLATTLGIAQPTDTVVIDPWFRSRIDASNGTDSTLFPYDTSTGSGISPNYYGPGTAPRLLRLTVFANPALIPYHRQLADRVFTSHDDLSFSEPTRAEQRPQSMATTSAAAAYQGDYSWLATVTPALSQRYSPGGYKTMFTVSVAVFQKRVPQAPSDANDKSPSERICLVDFIGGGDVRFRVPNTADSSFLKMRPNQWILLAGYEATGGAKDTAGNYLDPVRPVGTGRNRGLFKWYRIAATGDVATDGGANYVRYATLAGPDWCDGFTPNFDSDGDGIADGSFPYDADGDNTNGMTLHAYLLTDCVAVVERTVKFDPMSQKTY